MASASTDKEENPSGARAVTKDIVDISRGPRVCPCQEECEAHRQTDLRADCLWVPLSRLHLFGEPEEQVERVDGGHDPLGQRLLANEPRHLDWSSIGRGFHIISREPR